ncbi:MAG TPA: glycosyltransferase family 4 protein [Phycisphaerae bacterium]|nr:glycosyltransferase family 4 protein [Phycisphaerae bacterium]
MDIAFWLDDVQLAQETAFVRHLVMGLKAEGQQVTFLARSDMDLSQLPTLGSRCLTYRWNGWERLPVLQKLRLNGLSRTLADNPPDVLVVWGSADAAIVGALADAVPALPMVLWAWDASELFSPLARLPAIRQIIASSVPIASRLPANYATPVTVIHPGTYTEETVACYDVEGQLPCLVSLDPLEDKSAYEALIKACRMLVDTNQDFLLFAYDTGQAEYAIWRVAEQLNILDRFSFVPYQHDTEPLLLHGDLYIHILPASRVQYRTLEAMGRGLAVITTPNHAADYLLDNQTCRVVGPQTADAWHEVLREMTQDRPRAAAIARKAQQFIRDRHSMARTLEQFGSICRQAAGVAIPLPAR